MDTAHWFGPLQRWRICPSTHCERWQECRSPHECSGTGKNLTPERRAELAERWTDKERRPHAKEKSR